MALLIGGKLSIMARQDQVFPAPGGYSTCLTPSPSPWEGRWHAGQYFVSLIQGSTIWGEASAEKGLHFMACGQVCVAFF